MAEHNPDESPVEGRRAVGVYDRPAKADRFRNRKLWIAVIVVLAIGLTVVFYLMRR